MTGDYLYYLGLDLGQARDYSALAIIEEQLWIDPGWEQEILHADDYDRGLTTGWVSPATITPHQASEAVWHARTFGRPSEKCLLRQLAGGPP